ncbi:MAG TPA: glycosyltransferase [Polyangiaceae bacterium]|jgi:alpha-1,6-mannosyltransferase
MKVVDVTEFYSERGGGVRSHLSHKSQVSCQLGVHHVVVAPGPRDANIDVTGSFGANQATHSIPHKSLSAAETAAADAEGEEEAQKTGRPAEERAEEKKKGSARLLRFAGPALPYDPTYHLMWRLDKIRRRLREERPDVLGIQSPYAAAAVALSVPRADFGVRVFTWHSDFIDTYLRVMLERHAPPALASVALEPLWAMVRTIARGCDATFVASRWQKEKLVGHGVPRVEQLPFGIERSLFSPARRDERTRAELLGEGRSAYKLVVGVGRFAVEKRWDVVLDAFLRARESERAVLVLYGDGPERERMRARVAGRDDVKFMGFERDRAKLATALASADALLHGCPYETFGLSIAEAMSAGLPAVVPDEGGAAEMVEGESGEHYASLDVHGCARALVRLLRRDPASLRKGALDAAARVPDVGEQFARMFDAYARLLGERRP